MDARWTNPVPSPSANNSKSPILIEPLVAVWPCGRAGGTTPSMVLTKGRSHSKHASILPSTRGRLAHLPRTRASMMSREDSRRATETRPLPQNHAPSSNAAERTNADPLAWNSTSGGRSTKATASESSATIETSEETPLKLAPLLSHFRLISTERPSMTPSKVHVSGLQRAKGRPASAAPLASTASPASSISRPSGESLASTDEPSTAPEHAAKAQTTCSTTRGDLTRQPTKRRIEAIGRVSTSTVPVSVGHHSMAEAALRPEATHVPHPTCSYR